MIPPCFQCGNSCHFTVHLEVQDQSTHCILHVNTVAPIGRITVSPLDLNSHAIELCPLHHELDWACQQIERAFEKVTVAQLFIRPGSVKPLCDQ